MQDPEKYLNALSISVASLIDPEKPAVLDSAHRSNIGYEVFFFADDDEKRRFNADPSEYCGILTDPITKARFWPSEASPHFTYNGYDYLFASDSTRAIFAMMPDMYWLPRHQMIPDSLRQKTGG